MSLMKLISFCCCSDDWQFERGSHVFFLGDPIHFEISAIMGNHMPLRVYADHCVATATPDTDSTSRYDFIEYHGLAQIKPYSTIKCAKLFGKTII